MAQRPSRRKKVAAPVFAPLSHRPHVLYDASVERIDEAEILFQRGSWAMAMYTAGLAVEALLQAYALRAGSPHDARHDLRLWLERCPAPLVDTITRDLNAEWWYLTVVWNNALRYLSRGRLLGHLRQIPAARPGKGGPEAVLKIGARRCIDAARAVHGTGVHRWFAS